MTNTYTPDSWVVLEFVTPDKTIQKVFAGWYGGFGCGETWKLNSGITQIRELDAVFEFDGYSGSVYRCAHSNYGMTGYMQAILGKWMYDAEERGDVEINIIELANIVV